MEIIDLQYSRINIPSLYYGIDSMAGNILRRQYLAAVSASCHK